MVLAIKLLVILLLSLTGLEAIAQETTGDSLKNMEKSYDSLLYAGKITRFTDSLKILAWGDSMGMKVNSHFAKLKGLGHTPDSL